MRKLILVFLLALLFTIPAHAQAPQGGSATWSGTQHGVQLTFTPSTTSGVTYFIYRGTTSGGPYTALFQTSIACSGTTSCTYLDPASGLTVSTTYYYVATAVSGSDESAYSNQASVATPASFQTNPTGPTSLAGAVK